MSYCPLPPFKLHRRNRVEHPRGSSYKPGQLGVWWNAPCRDAAWGDAVNRRKRRSTFTHSLRGTTAAPLVNMFLLVSVCCLNAVDTRYNFSLHRWFLRCFVLPHHPGSAHLTQGMVVLMFQPHRFQGRLQGCTCKRHEITWTPEEYMGSLITKPIHYGHICDTHFVFPVLFSI